MLTLSTLQYINSGHEKDFSVLRILRIIRAGPDSGPATIFFRRNLNVRIFSEPEKQVNKPIIAPIFGPVRKKNPKLIVPVRSADQNFRSEKPWSLKDRKLAGPSHA